MYTCIFCGNDYDDEGIEDLAPLSDDGMCCDQCFYLYVYPAKMREAMSQPEDDEDF